jgi:hypothetical protein
MGDWDGTGIMRIGVFRNALSYLDINGNDAWDGSDSIIPFGLFVILCLGSLNRGIWTPYEGFKGCSKYT